MSTVADSAAGNVNRALEQSVLRKVTLRLIPFMFIMYIFNYLDRQNVGFVKVRLMEDLHFSETIFGLGSGIFFIGYFLFEVPSNLIMERVGARKWMARIMVTWGIISCCMMFTNNRITFYALRFLLGVAEAGFFPGMILYLTYWFPAAERAKAISRFMTATPLAGALGAPLSGALLNWMGGIGGLKNWQWLFLVEGLPSFFLGFVVYFYLTDRPADAHWLTEEEKACLLTRLEREESRRRTRHSMSWGQALSNGTVMQLTAFYFVLQIAIYGFVFNLPGLIKTFKLDDFTTGLITAIPYTIAAISMVVAGMLSDLKGERKKVVGAASLIAAAGLGGASFFVDGGAPILAVLFLTVAAIGLWSTLGPFWSLPTSFLSGSAAAAGIAFINSVGNLGGFVGPYVMGWLKDTTHKNMSGLVLVSVSMLVACVLALTVHHDRSLEQDENE